MKTNRFLPVALILLRICVAGIFLAHAIVRMLNGSMEQFAAFLANKKLPIPTTLVWGITVFEILGGILLIANYAVRLIAAGFMGLLLIGILLIHAELGWFVGEHGTGGMEYSVVLIVGLLVVMAAAEPLTLGSEPNTTKSNPN